MCGVDGACPLLGCVTGSADVSCVCCLGAVAEDALLKLRPSQSWCPEWHLFAAVLAGNRSTEHNTMKKGGNSW